MSGIGRSEITWAYENNGSGRERTSYARAFQTYEDGSCRIIDWGDMRLTQRRKQPKPNDIYVDGYYTTVIDGDYENAHIEEDGVVYSNDWKWIISHSFNDKPSGVVVNYQGQPMMKSWHDEGESIRKAGGPQRIYYDYNGNIDRVVWTKKDGRINLNPNNEMVTMWEDTKEARGFTPESRKKFAKEVKSLVNRRKRKTAALKSLQNTILGKSLNERNLRNFRDSIFSYLK